LDEYQAVYIECKEESIKIPVTPAPSISPSGGGNPEDRSEE
jgi:hypothetical protein